MNSLLLLQLASIVFMIYSLFNLSFTKAIINAGGSCLILAGYMYKEDMLNVCLNTISLTLWLIIARMQYIMKN